jgi:hypothetical protein
MKPQHLTDAVAALSLKLDESQIALGRPVSAACLDRAHLIARRFLDLNARLPDNPRLFRFPGSSVVERRTVNPLVGGSNPSRGANKSISYDIFPAELDGG